MPQALEAQLPRHASGICSTFLTPGHAIVTEGDIVRLVYLSEDTAPTRFRSQPAPASVGPAAQAAHSALSPATARLLDHMITEMGTIAIASISLTARLATARLVGAVEVAERPGRRSRQHPQDFHRHCLRTGNERDAGILGSDTTRQALALLVGGFVTPPVGFAVAQVLLSGAEASVGFRFTNVHVGCHVVHYLLHPPPNIRVGVS